MKPPQRTTPVHRPERDEDRLPSFLRSCNATSLRHCAGVIMHGQSSPLANLNVPTTTPSCVNNPALRGAQTAARTSDACHGVVRHTFSPRLAAWCHAIGFGTPATFHSRASCE